LVFVGIGGVAHRFPPLYMSREENSRLQSWKEISEYLRKDVSTLIRWRKGRSLPVYSVPGGKRQGVFAYKAELDQWLRSGDRGSGSRGLGPDVRGLEDQGLEVRGEGSASGAPGEGSRARTDAPTAANHDPAGIVPDLAASLAGASPDAGSAPTGRMRRALTPHAGATPTGRGGLPVPRQRFWMVTVLAVLGISIFLVRRTLTREASPVPMEWSQPTHGGHGKLLEPPRLMDRLYFRLTGSKGSRSPDRSRIVFARGNALYTAAADGTGERKLTSTGYDPHWIRWSPDGKILRFTVLEPRLQLEEIWQVSADGSNNHQFLSDWSMGKYVCCGNWTADGQTFVFQATVNGRTDMWAVPENRSFFTRPSAKPIQIRFVRTLITPPGRPR
jgi:hypothetical protein